MRDSRVKRICLMIVAAMITLLAISSKAYAEDATPSDIVSLSGEEDSQIDYHDIANARVEIPEEVDDLIRYGYEEYYYIQKIEVYVNDEWLSRDNYTIEYTTDSPGPGRTSIYTIRGKGDYHGEQVIKHVMNVSFEEERYKNQLIVFEKLVAEGDPDGGYRYLNYRMPSRVYSGKAHVPDPVRVAWMDRYYDYKDYDRSSDSVMAFKGKIFHDLLPELREGIDYRVIDIKDNVDAGKAKIIIEGIGYYSGTLTATFNIDRKDQTITLIKQREFEVGETVNLGAKSDGGGALTFYSGDTSIATVDKSGNLTAKKEGYTDIYIEAANTKNYYAGYKDFTVYVVPKVAKWSGASKMPVSSTAAYTVKNGSIRVKKGSEGILSVKGKTVTAKKAGTGYLELLDSDKKVAKTKKVTVYAIASGSYEMQSCLDSNLVLDIQRKSKENSARMLVYTRNDGKNQRYQFKLQGDGSYEIVCVHSGKCVDVQGGGTEKSQPVIQYTWKSGANQKWRITVDSSNYVTFKNVKSGMCFDIQGGKAKKGAKMIQYTSNGGKNQKWVLNKK